MAKQTLQIIESTRKHISYIVEHILIVDVYADPKKISVKEGII